MKKRTIGNEDNYSRFKPYIFAFLVLALVFQFISGLTEGVGMFNFGESHGFGFWTNFSAVIIIAFGWEWSIAKGVQYCTRTLMKIIDSKITLDYKEISILLIVFVGLVVITRLSYKVSKENSEMSLNIFYKTFKRQTSEEDKELATISLEEIEKRYQERLTPIKLMFKTDTTAAGQTAIPLIKKARQNVEKWESKQQSSGYNYISKITAAKNEVQQVIADKANQIALATKIMNENLLKLQEWRQAQEAIIDDVKNGGITLTAANEAERERLYNEWMIKYSKFWADFAGLAVLLAIGLRVVINVMYELSEVEDVEIISREDKEPAFFPELWQSIIIALGRPARHRVRNLVKNASGFQAVPESIVRGEEDSREEESEENREDETSGGPSGVKAESDDYLRRQIEFVSEQIKREFDEKIGSLSEENRELARALKDANLGKRTGTEKKAPLKSRKKAGSLTPKRRSQKPEHLKSVTEASGFNSLKSGKSRAKLVQIEKRLKGKKLYDYIRLAENAYNAVYRKPSTNPETVQTNQVKLNWAIEILNLNGYSVTATAKAFSLK